MQDGEVIIGDHQNGVLAGKPVVIVENGVAREAGQIFEHISRCEEDTSYYGCVLDAVRVYETPYGRVRRHFWQSGPGLEKSGTDYALLAEIDEQLRVLQQKESMPVTLITIIGDCFGGVSTETGCCDISSPYGRHIFLGRGEGGPYTYGFFCNYEVEDTNKVEEAKDWLHRQGATVLGVITVPTKLFDHT